jgi:hypothetical protein
VFKTWQIEKKYLWQLVVLISVLLRELADWKNTFITISRF